MLTIEQVQSSNEINDSAKVWAIENLDYINSANKLLGSSLKVEKGEKEGFYTSILPPTRR